MLRLMLPFDGLWRLEEVSSGIKGISYMSESIVYIAGNSKSKVMIIYVRSFL